METKRQRRRILTSCQPHRDSPVIKERERERETHTHTHTHTESETTKPHCQTSLLATRKLLPQGIWIKASFVCASLQLSVWRSREWRFLQYTALFLLPGSSSLKPTPCSVRHSTSVDGWGGGGKEEETGGGGR